MKSLDELKAKLRECGTLREELERGALLTAIDALEGFSQHCIKPNCKCWACSALEKICEELG